jgi:L-ascorbate metabolism protein UlaG (beta-lactamase superfamily)
MSNLYHKDLYMPAGVLALEEKQVTFVVSEHAKKAALSDRHGVLTIPENIRFDGKDVVEAEFEGGKLKKLVVRIAYDAIRDAVYVFNVPDGLLKTVWLNLSTDGHATLKKELYKAAPVV